MRDENQHEDEKWMQRALLHARKAWGLTHPNPMVGSVLVDGGEVLAEGYHRQAGQPHAEIEALNQVLHPVPPKATLYVTLEPCSTKGRTGACTEAILAAGVKRVVIGALDPNPAHDGRGVALLREAGVEVVTGVLSRECEDLNLIFNHNMLTGEPMLAGKIAVTLDGKIATRMMRSRWITGEEARADVMHWRRLFPAIAVGAGTALTDQPRLSSRLDEEWCPWRLVCDGMLRTLRGPNLTTLYSDDLKDRTIVVTTQNAGLGYIRQLERQGIRVWALPGPETRIKVSRLKEKCREEGITGVYVEGGATLLSGFMQERGLDYLFVYQAPLILGDERAKPMLKGLRVEHLQEGLRLRKVHREQFGEDALCRGFLEYPERLAIDEAFFGNRE